MPAPPSAAELIAHARSEAGLTQAEVARRAQTSQPYVNRAERGVSEPTLRTLRRLLAVCGFNLDLRLVPRAERPLAELVRANRQMILDAAAARGATRVLLFGSVARGDEHATSDIDLLVEFAGRGVVLRVAGLRDELERLLQARVDVSTPELLKPEVRRTALAEAVPL